MNKLVFTTLFILFASLILGCTNDDEVIDKTLTVFADKSLVNEGDVVFFSAKNGGKEVSEVAYYVDDKQSANQFRFVKHGAYSVVAKKNGYIDSKPITVNVSDVVIEPGSKQLVLIASKDRAYVGDLVVLSVHDGEGIIHDATITQLGYGEVPNGRWIPSVAGTYNFKASKKGSKESEVISVIVDKLGDLDKNFVRLVAGGDSAITSTILYLESDIYDAPIFRARGDGRLYLRYHLRSFTSKTSYADITLDVLLPNSDRKKVLPDEVVSSDVFTHSVVYVVDGIVIQHSKVGEAISCTYRWGTSATASTQGYFQLKLYSSTIHIDYSGKYSLSSLAI